MKHFVFPIAALALSGCATIVDGTSQQIQLTSNAPGAACGVAQNGVQIVSPAPVPATHTIARRSGNLIVTCSAPGYKSGTVALMAGRNPLSVVGHLPAIVLGAGADSAFGGLPEYQNEAYVHLTRG
ncbi:MAG: hypothetical protein AAGB15_11090 [Pseudomonadota bacterium]